MPYIQDIPQKTFPWEMFMQAQQMKNQNRQQMNQDIAGIGQGLGGTLGAIGQVIQQRKRQKIMDQLTKAMNNQGQTSPLASAGASDTTNPNAQSIMSLATQLDPTGELYKNIAAGQKSIGMGTSGQSQLSTVYRNTKTGDVTDVPPEDMSDWKVYQVKPGQALQTVTNVPMQKERSKALEGRVEAWNRSIDTKQIDELAKTTGITQSQRNILQQNNMRADRALEIASKPMTWQEFGAVLTDAAAMMQGGVPHIDQYNNMKYPAWQEKFAQWNTYATGHPTENVPPEIAKRVVEMVQGIKTVDNHYLQMNAKFQQQMLGPTIRGGIKSMAPAINQMTQGMTGQQGQTQQQGIKGRSFNSVQEAEAANLPPGTKVMINGRMATVQ